MGAPAANGVLVPAGSDVYNPQADIVALNGSLHGRISILAANATARLALASSCGWVPSPTDPLVVFQVDTGADWVYNGTTWSAPYSASIEGNWSLTSGPLNVPDVTFTQLNCSTAIGTPASIFSNTAGAITVSQAGEYELTVAVGWVGTTSNSRRIIAVTNNCTGISSGGILASGVSLETSVVNAVIDVNQQLHTRRFTCAAGDVIRVYVFQDSGATRTVVLGSSTSFTGLTSMQIVRVA